MCIYIHVSTCRYMAFFFYQRSMPGRNGIRNTQPKSGSAKQKKSVEAPLGTCHMGCLTLEDIDIVEWQVGVELALCECCDDESLQNVYRMEQDCPIGSYIECAVAPTDVCWLETTISYGYHP